MSFKDAERPNWGAADLHDISKASIVDHVKIIVSSKFPLPIEAENID